MKKALLKDNLRYAIYFVSLIHWWKERVEKHYRATPRLVYLDVAKYGTLACVV